MAVPQNTVQTFKAVGIREDLSDKIFFVDYNETPFFTKTKKEKCTNRTPEWQIDEYADADPDNKAVEGDDVTPDRLDQPQRVSNVVQLMDKVVSVSTTTDAVTTAGRRRESVRQMLKKGAELRRDIEARCTGNYGSVLGNATTPGEMAGAGGWLASNVVTTGKAGGYDPATKLVKAATTGSNRKFYEPQLKTVIKKCWENGGHPDIVMMPGELKQLASTFAGIGQLTINANDSQRMARIVAAADQYKSDFGVLSLLPNALMPDHSVLVLDMSKWRIAFLQAIKRTPLAKTGHSNKSMLSCEVTLKCLNERSSGMINGANIK